MFSLATANKANREERGTMLVLWSLLIISHLFHPWIQTKTKFSATLVEREGECWSAQNFVKIKNKKKIRSDIFPSSFMSLMFILWRYVHPIPPY